MSALTPEAPLSRPAIKFKGGRLPAQPARPHLKLSAYLDHGKLAPAPAAADWVSKVPASAWGMLANDQIGDCTCAGVAHKRIGDVYANRDEILQVTAEDTVELYEQAAGYVPGDPSTDQGSTCQTVLEYWRKHGFLGEKPVAFAKVDISSVAEIKQAIAVLGQLYCGLRVPQSAEDQTNAGEPWTVVPGSPILGGHCVTVGAYDADGLTCVTWGQLQQMDWEFFAEYFDEAWAIVGEDFVAANTGKDIQGLSLFQLGQDFSALTGQPNPVPDPAAPHHRRLADELRAWLEEMGL